MAESKNTVGSKIGGVFRAIGRFIGRHKKLFTVLVALAVIAGIVLALTGGMRAGTGNAAAAPQTLTLARMDLEQIVSGTGTLQSATTREVTSSLSYEVQEIYVAEGDTVEAGQLLALLDSTDLDKEIADVRKKISEAQAQDSLSLAQAERKLQDAINTRDINLSKNESAVAEAAAALEKARLEEAAALAAKNLADAAVAATGYATVAAAEADEASSLITPAELADIKLLFEKQAAAQADYAKAQSSTAAAQTTYDKAVETRETTYRNDSISIENARDNVNTLKLKDSAASYRTQLEGYLDDKEDCRITAPIAGTITAMAAEVGQSAGGSAAMGATTGGSSLFTIEDTSHLELTASIPEYDAVTLRTGMRADITSDAIDGAEWQGTVKSISPKATDTSGNFTVVIEVTSPVEKLAIGMSAKVNIVTEATLDVFAVPYDAVTTNERGESVVYVLDETPPQSAAPPADAPDADATPAALGTPIVVQTGMETDYYIEISGDGLKEGLLILADPEGKNVDTGSGTGGFMMGGGF